MTTLAEIKKQSAGSLICDYMICKICCVVDREQTRIRVNSPCPECGKPGGVARLYFPVNISVLVDLVQQSYHSDVRIYSSFAPNSSTVGVILYFCTLREALLNHLLSYLFQCQKLTHRVSSKLLKYNKTASQKFNELFPALVGKSWAEAVEEASSHEGTDFRPVSRLMKSVSEIRNQFIHEGIWWGMTRGVATDSINSLFGLLQLFVAFHNIYARPKLVGE